MQPDEASSVGRRPSPLLPYGLDILYDVMVVASLKVSHRISIE